MVLMYNINILDVVLEKEESIMGLVLVRLQSIQTLKSFMRI